jgi:hypothetical protein
MDRGIRLESTCSYDENKYESLGVVNAVMSVSVSFTGPPPAKTSFFGTAPKAAPVDKQQKLTSTENQMLQALKKQLIMNAPPGTERLIDFKISPPENIAHSPEYILSMLASATAIKKLQPQAVNARVNARVNAPAQPLAQLQMSQPLAQLPQLPQLPQLSPQMSQPLAQLPPQMSQPLAQLPQLPQLPPLQPMSKPLGQLGGKKRNGRKSIKKRNARKTRKHRN